MDLIANKKNRVMSRKYEYFYIYNKVYVHGSMCCSCGIVDGLCR